jgi:hypothetical protein
MEEIILNNNIKVMYVTATSFPKGIQEAMERLHQLVPYAENRKYYGISRPEGEGEIVYRAAAEVLEAGEAERLGCAELFLKKGKYLGLNVSGFRKDPSAIGRAFEVLLKQPNLDPYGYCVERYANGKDEVLCMIRLDQR